MALKEANAALEADAENYNALVFAGLALHQLKCVKESVDVYRRAIASQPTQLLAWQVAYDVQWRL